jgi:hypothetical protein
MNCFCQGVGLLFLTSVSTSCHVLQHSCQQSCLGLTLSWISKESNQEQHVCFSRRVFFFLIVVCLIFVATSLSICQPLRGFLQILFLKISCFLSICVTLEFDRLVISVGISSFSLPSQS